MSLKTHIIFSCSLIFGLSINSLSCHGQENPIDVYDKFVKAHASTPLQLASYFESNGRVATMVYDTLGNPTLRSLSPKEYQRDMLSMHSNFEVQRTPLVLTTKQLGSVFSMITSTQIILVDKESNNQVEYISYQNVQMLQSDDKWRINHITNQVEHPLYPLDDFWKPKELTAAKTLVEKEMIEPMDVEPDLFADYDTDYDESKIYRLEEVDEPPTYPGDQDMYVTLLNQFNVTSQPTPGYAPFIVTILEDGSAELSYTHDLSGFQISRAESFVRSMLIWYPAIKYAASVKCKLIYYIRD